MDAQNLQPPLTPEQIAENEAMQARAEGLSWFMPIERITREELLRRYPPKENPDQGRG